MIYRAHEFYKPIDFTVVSDTVRLRGDEMAYSHYQYSDAHFDIDDAVLFRRIA